MSFLTTSQAQIYYHFEQAEKHAPVVTFLNGHMRRVQDVQRFASHMQDAGFATLVFDFRGAGKTSCEGPFTLSDHLDDVRSLWSELGINTSHVVAFSMGGFIAQFLAASSSERIASLVLCASFPDYEDLAVPGIRWSNKPSAARSALKPYFSEQFFKQNTVLVDGMAKLMTEMVEEGNFIENAHHQRMAMSQCDMDLLDHTLIRCPSLIVHGNKDQVAPLTVARKLNRLIADSQLEIMDGAGHLLLAECPQPLYELVRDWLVKQEKVRT